MVRYSVNYGYFLLKWSPFLDLGLSMTDGIVSSKSKMYDKRDDFNFDIANFPFLDEDVPRYPSNLARVDLSNRNQFLTS